MIRTVCPLASCHLTQLLTIYATKLLALISSEAFSMLLWLHSWVFPIKIWISQQMPRSQMDSSCSSRAQAGLKSAPVHLVLSDNHQDELGFFVINSPCVPIVLGHPWLVKYNPKRHRVLTKIVSLRPFCHLSALPHLLPYLLPLMNSTFDSVLGATVFNKKYSVFIYLDEILIYSRKLSCMLSMSAKSFNSSWTTTCQ